MSNLLKMLLLMLLLRIKLPTQPCSFVVQLLGKLKVLGSVPALAHRFYTHFTSMFGGLLIAYFIHIFLGNSKPQFWYIGWRESCYSTSPGFDSGVGPFSFSFFGRW